MDKLFEILLILDCDASKVKWAHAVNSKKQLADYLPPAQSDDDYSSSSQLLFSNNGNITTTTITPPTMMTMMMIESDVIVDQSSPTSSADLPIAAEAVMAHPPAVTSDLTFDQWLARIDRYPKAGGKADFKSMMAVETVFNKSALIYDGMTTIRENPVKLWLNADVCKGPANSSEPVIDGSTFVDMCLKRAPGCVLSLGWTTPPVLSLPDDHLKYGLPEISCMKHLVENFASGTLVTFAVRALLIACSDLDLFENELMINNSFTITVWTSASLDRLQKRDFEILAQLRSRFGNNRVFYDLPQNDLQQLQKLFVDH